MLNYHIMPSYSHAILNKRSTQEGGCAQNELREEAEYERLH